MSSQPLGSPGRGPLAWTVTWAADTWGWVSALGLNADMDAATVRRSRQVNQLNAFLVLITMGYALAFALAQMWSLLIFATVLVPLYCGSSVVAGLGRHMASAQITLLIAVGSITVVSAAVGPAGDMGYVTIALVAVAHVFFDRERSLRAAWVVIPLVLWWVQENRIWGIIPPIPIAQEDLKLVRLSMVPGMVAMIAVPVEVFKSERARAEAQLQRATLDAEAAARAKATFLATMSHEIRTPLSGVLGLTELLSQTELDAAQRRTVTAIAESGAALRVIIDDILDFSKLESGKLTLEETDLDLRTLVASVGRLALGQARPKGVRVLARVEPGVPRFVVGDPVRLRQVLTNLMNNAVKFTEEGEVTIRVSPADPPAGSAPGALGLRFEVIDTGIGIPEDALGRMFERFSQADVSTTRRFGGTGLGLAICRGIVETMGGELAVESHVGAGSTFTFTVGLCEGRDPEVGRQGRTAVAPIQWEGDRPLRVLLVEDNAINQVVARGLLERAISPLRLKVVEDGQQAVDACREERWDLVLMDCQMPVMDGLTATRLIRAAEEGGAHTPIVALTANAFVEDRERCLEVGMDDFLAKPIDPAQLEEVIAAQVCGWASHRAAAS